MSDGRKLAPQYPVYVISKGRHDCCYTADHLAADGCPFYIVVEPQEFELYAERYGDDRIMVLPFQNLGLGSIPARNWCWEHAKEHGHARHWILDDNIKGMYRRYRKKRIPCDSGAALHIAEQFVDRYENIAVAGLQYLTFAGAGMHGKTGMPPFYVNTHVYSCLLIDNSIPQRWRGRYNEDTDLCLQVLAAGYCTVCINAFLINKQTTMTMKGGNTTELYKGDGRLDMARSLERAWPYVVTTTRKYGRPQHWVAHSWTKFDTPLKRRTDIDWDALEQAGADNYGMQLRKVADEVKSPTLRAWLNEEQNG